MTQVSDSILEEGTLTGFQLQSRCSQSLEDTSESGDMFLWGSRMYYDVIKVNYTPVEVKFP